MSAAPYLIILALFVGVTIVLVFAFRSQRGMSARLQERIKRRDLDGKPRAWESPGPNSPRHINARFVHGVVVRDTEGWVQRPGRPKHAKDRRAEWGLPALASMEETLSFLGITEYTQLVLLADPNAISAHGGHDKRVRENPIPAKLANYHVRTIPKKSGGTRVLLVPKPRLKAVQRIILRGLLDRVPVHRCATAFAKGRSVLSHAAPHAGKRIVVTWDVREFFPSIPFRTVRRTFMAFGYSPKAARILGMLCTTRDPSSMTSWARTVPQGAPTSPALANAVCWRMDCRLEGLAKKFGATYTRYADDMAFSGDEEFARSLKKFIPRVHKIMHDAGFRAHEKKMRVLRSNARQQVTGLVVNTRPAPPREEFDLLKAILTNARRAGSLESQNRAKLNDFRSHIEGRIGWIEHHTPSRGVKLRKLLAAIPQSGGASFPSAPPPE